MSAPDVIVLGGGPAGLAAAHYAWRSGRSVLVLEKNARPGGNATTFRCGDHLYDSGAHRWHNVHPDITSDVAEILAGDLHRVEAPSSIQFRGRRLAFPLAPGNLARNLPWPELLAMAGGYLTRSRHVHSRDSFADHIQGKYGRRMAENFLWHYSHKLWGESPERLSREVAGGRLKGLGMKAFLHRRAEHLDGAFLYPSGGIGQIFDALASRLPMGAFQGATNLVSLEVRDGRVGRVTWEGGHVDASASLVVNTLSPDVTAGLLGMEDKSTARSLRFRHVVLLFLEVLRPSVSANASVYFPSPKVPFTRVVEPRNRSSRMAPPGRTSLVIELPCFAEDDAWGGSDESLLGSARTWMGRAFGIREDEFGLGEVRRMPRAYPVLERSAPALREAYLADLGRLANMRVLGRNATFSYLHLHDLFHAAKGLFRAG